MAWTAPATATVGQILTANFMNAQLRDNMLQTAPALITADGEMVIGTAANALKALDVMGALDVFLHEVGGLEADVSAYDGFPLIDGGATANWKMSFTEVDAPDANDDTTDGWKVGSLWVDVTNDKAYICLDITDTAAVWIEITQGVNHTVASHSDTTATGAELETLTDGSDASALHNHHIDRQSVADNGTAGVTVTFASAFTGTPVVVAAPLISTSSNQEAWIRTNSTTAALVATTSTTAVEARCLRLFM